MQSLIQGRKIEEDDKKEVLLRIISDKYCREIISSTMDEPKSAMTISIDQGIPISTVYRRLQSLFENKLLRISGTISEDGKKYFLYKSKVKAVSAAFNGNNIEIEIVPNPKSAGEL